MKILNLVQGSDDWHHVRANHPTASTASVMMGKSKHITRTEMIRMKATGDEIEYSKWVQEVLFERGHEVEEKSRPIAEKIIGEMLYPATALDDQGYLLASFDGCTMDETIIWECKQWNASKSAYIQEFQLPPEEDYWQVVQQLAVSGAKKALYMISDGTDDNTVYCWLKLQKDDYEKLLAGWKQFEEDIANYQHVETKVQPTGVSPDQLPALHIVAEGNITSSNLNEFRGHALAVINNINTDLQTDEDFSNAAKTIKWCESVEAKLEAVKDSVLAQTVSIDEVFRTIDSIKEATRAKRLDLTKLATERKKAIRSEIHNKAKDAWQNHINQINKTLGGKIYLPLVKVDFAGAMKGKRTVDSLRSAVNDELARAKIEANQIADRILINLNTLREDAKDYPTLFPDAQQLVEKENDDLKNLIKTRIADHKAEEEQKAEEKRQAEEKRLADEQRIAEEARIASEAAANAMVDVANTSDNTSANIEAPAEAVSKTDPPPAQTLRSPVRYGGVSYGGVAQTPNRPSDVDIISTLAQHYRVHEQTVISWLLDMNLEEASEKIAV